MSNKKVNRNNKTNGTAKRSLNKKTILIATIAVTAVVAVLIGIWVFAMGPTKETAGIKGISVSIVHKDGSMRVFTYSTEMVYLGDALEEKDLIKPGDNDNGVVHTVHGEKADSSEQAFWKLFIDGKEADTGIYDTMVQNGKSYRLEYTIGK